MKTVVDTLVSSLGLPESGLSSLMEAAASVGIDSGTLASDLERVVRERIFMWLVSSVDGSFSYQERKHIIERRLRKILPRFDLFSSATQGELVSAIATAQVRIATARTERKAGLSHIYLSECDALMTEQGYRCASCGVPLSHRTRRECERFESGVEPLETAVLDHVDPFYLGGNTANYQLLCSRCNVLKNDFTGVQEDGVVLCGNFLRNRRGEHTRRRMIFWTLSASGGCEAPECCNTSCHSMLWVDRFRSTVPFAYGNLSVYCTDHAPGSAVWIHSDVSSGFR